MNNTALFLGSGGSAVFGFPTSVELLDILSKSTSNHYWGKLIEISPSKDIEESLQEMEKIENGISVLAAHKFFNRYHSQESSNTSPNPEPKYGLTNFVDEIKNLKNQVTQILIEQFDLGNVTPSVLQPTYFSLFSFLMQNQNVLDIFTTNYDSVLEEFVTNYRDKYYFNEGETDGKITHMSLTNLPSHENLKLLNVHRLHGSLNWVADAVKPRNIKKIINSEMRHRYRDPRTRLITPPILGKKPSDNPLLVPFFDLYKKKILTYDNLIILGFSFRDEDISKLIKERIELNKFSTFVISPDAEKDVCQNLFNNVGKEPEKHYISGKCQKLLQNFNKFHIIPLKFNISNTPTIIQKLNNFDLQSMK